MIKAQRKSSLTTSNYNKTLLQDNYKGKIMSFWNRTNSNKVVLHCYTYDKQTYDLFPIDKSINYMPGWWKDLNPRYEQGRYNDFPTMKSCSSVNGFLTRGVTIPMWTDASLGVAVVKNMYGDQLSLISEFANQTTKCQIHEQKQISEEFLPEQDFINFKIHAPWVFKTDEELDWVWTQPTYNYTHPDIFTVLPGIIEFKHNHNVFLNISMRKMLGTNPLLLNLDGGDPVVNLIPMSNKSIEVKNHLVSKDEWDKIYSETNPLFFKGNYKKIIKIKKEKEKKCPFGFGGNK
jgi:hypothetical protein